LFKRSLNLRNFRYLLQSLFESFDFLRSALLLEESLVDFGVKLASLSLDLSVLGLQLALNFYVGLSQGVLSLQIRALLNLLFDRFNLLLAFRYCRRSRLGFGYRACQLLFVLSK
jgi:hypothetical protein